jgi:hypothetical protein
VEGVLGIYKPFFEVVSPVGSGWLVGGGMNEYYVM